MNIPKDLRYTKNDEWVKVEGENASIGLTDYAQDQLSDIVYLEISLDIDAKGKQGDMFGSVESVKAAADVYLPISGKVSAKNDALSDMPETLNSDPYGEGWIIKLTISDKSEIEGLLDADAYEKFLAERDA